MQTAYYILLLLGAIPSAWLGVKWITKRTKTKKDDKLVEKIDANSVD